MIRNFLSFISSRFISDRIQFRTSNRQPLCFLYFPSAVLFYIIYIQNRAYTPLFLLCIYTYTTICVKYWFLLYSEHPFFSRSFRLFGEKIEKFYTIKNYMYTRLWVFPQRYSSNMYCPLRTHKMCKFKQWFILGGGGLKK